MSLPFELHHLVKRGEFQRVSEILGAGAHGINEYDNGGFTPLMYAVESPAAGVRLLRLLIDHGADSSLSCLENSRHGIARPVVSVCLGIGDPQKLAVLLEYGADIHYDAALIDAVHGREIRADGHLIDLLKLLVGCGVSLSGIGPYQESGLRVLSRWARFDAVQVLLDAGADETQLAWTPLIRAAACGSIADMENALATGGGLEDRDWWSRTAYLVAVQIGDTAKANLLLDAGADREAHGPQDQPALFYAIENHQPAMLKWQIERGAAIEEMDESGRTPLIWAAECGNPEAIEILLGAGADVNGKKRARKPVSSMLSAELAGRLLRVGIDVDRADGLRTAMSYARNARVAEQLLRAGADPAELPFAGRRTLVGLAPERDNASLDLSLSNYQNGWSRRYGVSNPEEMVEPFWEGMIRAGVSASQAADFYGRPANRRGTEAPVWCAERFGQSVTLLPDGRMVQIGGEHEDFYDQDFCIYNDVFVHEADGTIRIFGYPESVFPPTDFHTATLMGAHIYIIGSMGYSDRRQHGVTPVYCLDTRTFRIDRVGALGEGPGWISRHGAVVLDEDELGISGGKVFFSDGATEIDRRNEGSFVLDTKRLIWRRWA